MVPFTTCEEEKRATVRRPHSRDTHFVLELIQNADDNAYAEGVHPTLAFLPGARRTNRRPFPVHP